MHFRDYCTVCTYPQLFKEMLLPVLHIRIAEIASFFFSSPQSILAIANLQNRTSAVSQLSYLFGVFLMSRPSHSLWEPDGHQFIRMGRPLDLVSICLSPCPRSIILGIFLAFSTFLSFSRMLPHSVAPCFHLVGCSMVSLLSLSGTWIWIGWDQKLFAQTEPVLYTKISSDAKPVKSSD